MDTLSQVFAALADPTRRAIVARLARGPSTVGALAEPFAMSLPAVSRHLKVLEQAGLIERTVEAQWRRCRLRPHGLKPASDWLERQANFWAGSFDRLDKMFASERKPTKGGRNGRSRRGR
jgi:DNA-binding transcriptional ArsR family regulator